MKHKFLTAILFAAAVSQVACDNKSSSEKAQDCMADPVCRQTVVQSTGGQLFPLASAQAASGQVPTALINQPFKVSTVANAAIKQQSLKVAQGLKENAENPWSDYHQFEAPVAPKATQSVAPSRATASEGGAPSIVSSGSASDGEATR
jgi:hypothetical protein